MPGICYKTEVGQGQFDMYFELPNRKCKEGGLQKFKLPPFNCTKALKDKKICKKVNKIEKFISYCKEWKSMSLMGTKHIQTSSGVVFNAPFASGKKWQKSTRKNVGTIIKQIPRKFPIFYVAEGSWLEKFDGNENSDPTNQEQTGASFAKGNFYSLSQDLDHFVVGAPNANNMKGRVYICHDCFGTHSKEHRRELEASQPQIGERFGATVARVSHI